MLNQNFKIEDVLKKVEELKKTGGIDLSIEEDLSIAVMHLISLEEHFYFTEERTNKPQYFDFMQEIRETRKVLLKKLIDTHEGETWCISKHLLGATMRLIEVGTRLQANNKKDEAKDVFDRAYKIYSLFWALRLKLINTAGLKEIAVSEKPWTTQDIMNKLVNCCDE